MAVDTRYVTHSKWTSLTPTETTYPNGRQVTSGYDALYHRNTVNETSGGASIAAWQFFGNRTATVALGNGITNSFMNNAGTNSAVQSGVPLPAWGDKTTDRLGYDGSGRMIAKRFLPSGSTTSLVGFTTAYDPSSNKQFERALQGDESRSALYPGYDSMDRLLQYQRGILASGGGSVTTPITLPGTDNNRVYNLDGLGNWRNTVFTPEGGSATTEIRQHNKLNEITQFATTPVTYDHGNNAGNSNPLIAQRGNGNIANDGPRIYAYDALNRLTTVKRKSDNAQVAAYTYDALGRRVLKTVTNGGIPTGIANVTYRYLYGGQQIVEELLVGGTTTTLRQFVWGQYIDELIQLNIPTNNTTPPLTAGTYYPLQDLLYRIAATTDTTGTFQESYDYDVYGNTLIFNSGGTTVPQPMCEFLFTGRQYDPETEIYWYRRRYYAPSLGRFISRDLIEQRAGYPNTYLYVNNRPEMLTDPSGLAATQPTTQPAPPAPRWPNATTSLNSTSTSKTADIADYGTIIVAANVSLQGAPTGQSDLITIEFTPNDPACKCRWLQFVKTQFWFGPFQLTGQLLVRDDFPGFVQFSNQWAVDTTPEKGGAFYDLTGDYSTNSAGGELIYDSPTFPSFLPPGVVMIKFFDDYLICNQKAVAHVHWERSSSQRKNGGYQNLGIDQATNLPTGPNASGGKPPVAGPNNTLLEGYTNTPMSIFSNYVPNYVPNPVSR